MLRQRSAQSKDGRHRPFLSQNSPLRSRHPRKRKTTAIAALAIVRNDQGKILMQKRNDPKNSMTHLKWEFPGGGIEFDETAEQTAIREVKEENGLTVKSVGMVPYVHINRWEFPDASVRVVLLSFVCVVISGTVSPSHREVVELGWFSPNEIGHLDTIAGCTTILDAYLSAYGHTSYRNTQHRKKAAEEISVI